MILVQLGLANYYYVYSSKEKISSNVQYLNAYRTNLGENDESDILLLVIIVVKYEINHNAQHNE